MDRQTVITAYPRHFLRSVGIIIWSKLEGVSTLFSGQPDRPTYRQRKPLYATTMTIISIQSTINSQNEAKNCFRTSIEIFSGNPY